MRSAEAEPSRIPRRTGGQACSSTHWVPPAAHAAGPGFHAARTGEYPATTAETPADAVSGAVRAFISVLAVTGVSPSPAGYLASEHTT